MCGRGVLCVGLGGGTPRVRSSPHRGRLLAHHPGTFMIRWGAGFSRSLREMRARLRWVSCVVGARCVHMRDARQSNVCPAWVLVFCVWCAAFSFPVTGGSRQPRCPASRRRARDVGFPDWWGRFLGPDFGPENGTNTKYTHSGCISCLSHFPALFLGRNPGPHLSCDVGVPGGAWCARSVFLRQGCCCKHLFERWVACAGCASQWHVPCHVLCVVGSLLGSCPSAWRARPTAVDMDHFFRSEPHLPDMRRLSHQRALSRRARARASSAQESMDSQQAADAVVDMDI